MPTGRQQYSTRKDENVAIEITLADFRFGLDAVEDNSKKLISTSVESLDLVSELVSPLMTGKIIYTDDQSAIMIDTVGNQDLYCRINIEISAGDDDEKKVNFTHFFYVTAVNILENSKAFVTYEILLVSTNVWEFLNNHHVSTFNKEDGESVGVVVQALLAGSNLVIVEPDTMTNTKIKYISPAKNSVMDSLFEIFERAMSVPDDSLFLLPFDHMKNVYNMWDKKVWDAEILKESDPDMLIKYRNAFVIPVEKVDDVDIVSNEIGSLITTSHINNTEIIKAIKNTINHTFDYDTNTFDFTVYESKIIAKKFAYEFNNPKNQNRLENKEVILLDEGVELQSEQGLNQSFMPSFYERLMDCLTKNTTLVINVSGWMNRRPGLDGFIIVDSKPEDSTSLLTLEGRWLMTKVRHSFTKTGYRNNIVMTRMEIPTKTEDLKEEL